MKHGTYSNVIDHKPITLEALQETWARIRQDMIDHPITLPTPGPISAALFQTLVDCNIIDRAGCYRPIGEWNLENFTNPP